MLISTVLALMTNAIVFAFLAQPQSRLALHGIWESEGCVVQERGGVRTSSKSVFVFLDREWALEVVQFADDHCAQRTMKAFLTGPYHISEDMSVVAGANH